MTVSSILTCKKSILSSHSYTAVAFWYELGDFYVTLGLLEAVATCQSSSEAICKNFLDEATSTGKILLSNLKIDYSVQPLESNIQTFEHSKNLFRV